MSCLHTWPRGLAPKSSRLFIFQREEERAMKYGVAVTIKQIGYIEVDADSEAEAKAKAEETVSEDRVLYHETEVKECKIEGYF